MHSVDCLVGYRYAFSLPYYAGLCIVLYLAWVGFTTLGALLGPVLGDINRFGFDMAFPAIMLVLLKACGKALLKRGLG